MAQRLEEYHETVIEATNGNNNRLIYKASDLYITLWYTYIKGLRIEDEATDLKRHKNRNEYPHQV